MSRASLSTTPQDIATYLSEKQLKPREICKLKTQHNAFNSFCLIVEAEQLQDYLKSDLWPSNVLFKEFEGGLHNSRVAERFPVPQETD